MPECDRIRKQLSYYAVGGVRGGAHARVERHLASCAACRAELTALERTGAIVTSVGPVPAPPGTWEAIRDQILDRPRQAVPRPARRFWRVAIGVAALLIFALAVAFVRPFRAPQPPIAVAVELEADDTDTPATIESHLSAQWSAPLADEAAVGLRLSELGGS